LLLHICILRTWFPCFDTMLPACGINF
jgi:hypothetical protein